MNRTLDALVDVMRVPVDGDPSVSLVRVPDLASARDIECDVLIVGGGTGGVAAALAAARRGRRVHLVEETDWIGGQLTSQGVSAGGGTVAAKAAGSSSQQKAMRSNNALMQRKILRRSIEFYNGV